MNTEIKSYIRSKSKTNDNNGNPIKGSPIGMIIARKQSDGKITIGWSLCMKKDRFDHDNGYKKATSRQYELNNHRFVPSSGKVTNSVHNNDIFVPITAWKTFQMMIDRSHKYFKV